MLGVLHHLVGVAGQKLVWGQARQGGRKVLDLFHNLSEASIALQPSEGFGILVVVPRQCLLARRFADLDSDDNAVDFAVLEDPTPGSAPFSGIPEPRGPRSIARADRGQS